MSKAKRKVLVVVMDGVGERDSDFGNAVKLAQTPYLHQLAHNGLYRTLKAHGTFVGLPSDADIGNSEVGHNALGAGRVFDQGAKLVQEAIDTGLIFKGSAWQEAIKQCLTHQSSLHLLGLLSDGNVHAHENHLYALMRQAAKEGVKKIRLHILFDGRDVGEKSAEIYVEHLNAVIAEVKALGVDVAVASGGGRMSITMDRYEADWAMVQRGWDAHVLGEADLHFSSLDAALASFRALPDMTDQYIPAFIIDADGRKFEGIQSGDAVILFNFRGDRAIEISRAFTEESFPYFDRKRVPKVFFAGMMEYDGDLHIPPKYLVSPPLISDTLSEHLVKLGLRQFACSETQKFGHVTYFWNGNRSGKFDEKLEDYVEVPSDNIPFDLKPWMKAYEITEVTIRKMREQSFDFGRINYPNGDMVGHTGNLEASIIAMETVDQCVGRLLKAADETGTILIFTADHGNCDEMFDAKDKGAVDWLSWPLKQRPKPKTAHTLNPVPFYIYDPKGYKGYRLRTDLPLASIANMPGTVLALMGLPAHEIYLPSVLELT